MQAVALAAGLAWASGLRLYLVLFLAGLLSHLGYLQLPESLKLLEHPLVMGASGLLLLAETVADKVPGFDSFWDSLQTFVRIPAGGLFRRLLARHGRSGADAGGGSGRRHDHGRHRLVQGRRAAGDQHLARAAQQLDGLPSARRPPCSAASG